MKRTQSSAITNFDAINRHQFFYTDCIWHEKMTPESGIKFMAPVSGACVRGFIQSPQLRCYLMEERRELTAKSSHQSLIGDSNLIPAVTDISYRWLQKKHLAITTSVYQNFMLHKFSKGYRQGVPPTRSV